MIENGVCSLQEEESGNEEVLVGPDGSPLLDPLGRPLSKDHNPRDGQLPPPGVGGHEGGKKPQTLEEKLAQRRIDELKWLVEFAEKVIAYPHTPIFSFHNHPVKLFLHCRMHVPHLVLPGHLQPLEPLPSSYFLYGCLICFVF